MPHVLFVCKKNSGRSQMAEAFFQNMAQDRATSESAGSDPAPDLDPVVVTAMKELGLNLDGKRPRPLTSEMEGKSDRVISMGCTPVPERATDVWDFDDPSGQPLDVVRRIRDQIRARVEILAADLNVARPGTASLKTQE
ncbi:MAG: heat-shock protein HtpX [Candidatus Sericytochromatia bacterium]|uniref:Heat-shock protein HtpX n=1 Tax=Candidatus Tanganyikabacteria bacterium TaxID=2961651 RepID=A0A937X4Q1_9BACT|nr:heat-shock protein HtpX [Candidatus Tanganyikabacteria bacterium]